MRRIAVFLWLAVVLLAVSYLSLRVLSGLTFETDLMALLPHEQQEPSVQAANDAVTKVIARRIVILIGARDKNYARAAALEIERQLSASGLFALTSDNLDKDRLHQIGTFYYPYRSGLLADEDRDLLKAGRGEKIAARALAQTYGMFGLANAKLLQNDPFLLMPNFLTHLPVPLSRFSPDDGFLSMRDNDRVWILVTAQLKGEPFALDIQKKVVTLFDHAAQSQKLLYPELKILHLGAVFFAQAGAEQAMHETSVIGVASTFGALVLVLAMFRAIRPLLLSLLVIGVGIVTGIAASLWIFGQLHVVALLFGISLIGVVVDYSLQYCSEIFAQPHASHMQRLKRVLAGISLGTATTVIGYLTFYLAPFPGLRQIAAFSVVGLCAAWLTVVLWLPLLDRERVVTHGRRMLDAAGGFLAFWQLPRYRLGRVMLLGVLLFSGAVGFARFHADDDVRHLQSLSPVLVTEQQQIQKLTGTLSSGPFFLVHAKDDETVLQREEELAEQLRPLVVKGALSGFQSISQYIPSVARQTQNRGLQNERLYSPLLAKQAVNLNLSHFPQPPDQWQPLLKLTDLSSSVGPMAFLSNLMMHDANNDPMHIVMLEGVLDTDALVSASKAVPGVRLIDPVNDFSALFVKYRNHAVILLALSALLMSPLLIWRYGISKGFWVMMPPSLAVFLTPALRGLTGAPFTFFDAMALVLILSIGVDYAVFCAETSNNRKAVTMLAVAMAACTALMSFGLLAFSDVPAVHNFGTTMTIGISLSFLFAPLARLASKEHSTFSLRHLISVALVLLLCGCVNAAEPIAQPRITPVAVNIGPNVLLTLPDPSTLGHSVEATQLVTVHYGNQDFSFEAHISASPERLLFAGLDLMGRTLIEINWTKAQIVYQRASWVPAQLQPENILADLVLLYWPRDIIQKNLTPSDVKLATSAKHREIVANDKVVWTADYRPLIRDDLWSGSLSYSNLVWGYIFGVQSMEATP